MVGDGGEERVTHEVEVVLVGEHVGGEVAALRLQRVHVRHLKTAESRDLQHDAWPQLQLGSVHGTSLPSYRDVRGCIARFVLLSAFLIKSQTHRRHGSWRYVQMVFKKRY